MNYEIVKTLNGTALKGTTDDGIEMWIPIDEANSDYQAYLLSLKE